MRAAHLQMLERLEPGRGDPVSLRIFAERVRNHFFDLSRIIERICKKLGANDRQAWHDRRTILTADNPLASFGTWLCDRAAGYLNPYDIAEEQLRASDGVRRLKRQVHHQKLSHQRTDLTSRKSCERCNGEHRLDQCNDFKKLHG